jgi:predicted transcriptional regulator
MIPKYRKNNDLSEKVKRLLLQNPGLSIKEVAKAADVNRQFMAGFLFKMEEKGEVASRKVGAAIIYFSREAVAK